MEKGADPLAGGDHSRSVQPARGAGEPLDRPGNRDRGDDLPALAAHRSGHRRDSGLTLGDDGRPAPGAGLGPAPAVPVTASTKTVAAVTVPAGQ